MRILVVEDEHRIAQAIKKGLEQEKYAVDVVYNGTDGYDFAMATPYDVIILDLMLPGIDGIEVCQKLRRENIHTPVIMLTAKSTIENRVTGLDTGADDYLTKPFAFTELLARIRALLRRPKQDSGVILEYDDVSLDTSRFVATKGKVVVGLSGKEYALLEYMLRHKGMVLTKEQITDHVWNYDADILPNTVEVYVRKLRQKLGSGIIGTIRGFGYRIG